MKAPAFNDRIEKKFQLGIDEAKVAALWRDLRCLLRPYGLDPAQEITSVGSVYFDNKDCDLLRFSLLGHLMVFRTRAYELFGNVPESISEYWVEVKTAQGPRRYKRRFRLTKPALREFLNGGDLRGCRDGLSSEGEPDDDESYRQSQETLLTMGLAPLLLVTCKRVAFQNQTSRLSIDWDVQYYHVANDVYDFGSWKYLSQPSVGKARKVILEVKCLVDEGLPAWFSEIQQNYPVWEREYLKPVEGMGFLFAGPLSNHKEANYFLPRINAYMKNSLLG